MFRRRYTYPKAGIGAPKEVKKAIQRFRRLPAKVKRNTPLLYWLLGDGTPPYKMSKPDSDYIDLSPYKHKCINCRYMYHQPLRKENICSQIRGQVSPDGWCRLWEGHK